MFLPSANQNTTVLDYSFCYVEAEDDEDEDYHAIFFAFMEKRELDPEPEEPREGAMQAEGGDRAIVVRVLTKYRIMDLEAGRRAGDFKVIRSVVFGEAAELVVSRRTDDPLFFVYLKPGENRDLVLDSGAVNRLRVFNGSLEAINTFDMGGFVLDFKNKFNFAVLDEDLFLVRLKKEKTAEQSRGQNTAAEGAMVEENQQNDEEIVETVVFDINTKERKLLTKPEFKPGKKASPAISASPLMYTGEGLACFWQKGLEAKKRESNQLHYYPLE